MRQLQQAIKKAQNTNRAIQSGEDKDVARLQQIISQSIGSQVEVDCDINQQSGWLKIRYFDNDTLAGILDRMGVPYAQDET